MGTFGLEEIQAEEVGLPLEDEDCGHHWSGKNQAEEVRLEDKTCWYLLEKIQAEDILLEDEDCGHLWPGRVPGRRVYFWKTLEYDTDSGVLHLAEGREMQVMMTCREETVVIECK